MVQFTKLGGNRARDERSILHTVKREIIGRLWR
jgi:hypothetical protein